jgi:Zn-dependent protease with chaperone function
MSLSQQQDAVSEYAEVQVRNAAQGVPGLSVAVVARHRLLPNLVATIIADHRIWRVGRLRFGPLHPAEIIVAPAAAEHASEEALRGAIAHEMGHVQLRHAFVGWVRLRCCLALYVALVWSISVGSTDSTALITMVVTASLALAWQIAAAFFRRREEIAADVAAVRTVGLDATLAFLEYCRAVDRRWVPRNRWLRRLVFLVDSHPATDDRVAVARRAARAAAGEAGIST